jgi:hypothetical protein
LKNAENPVGVPSAAEVGSPAKRARERRVSQDDLFELAEWKGQDPDVPDGDWYKDFGTFKLCGTGKFPSTFLMAGQSARGKRL